MRNSFEDIIKRLETDLFEMKSTQVIGDDNLVEIISETKASFDYSVSGNSSIFKTIILTPSVHRKMNGHIYLVITNVSGNVVSNVRVDINRVPTVNEENRYSVFVENRTTSQIRVKVKYVNYQEYEVVVQ